MHSNTQDPRGRRLSRVVWPLLAAACCVASIGAAATLEATVEYTGAGAVDSRHGLLFFLFESPDLSDPTNRILAARYVTENGTTVRFADLDVEQAYFVVAYDELGGYDGTGGIPGPFGVYGGDGPVPILLDDDTTVRMTFDDSVRPESRPNPPDRPLDAMEAAEHGIVEVRIYRLQPGERESFLELLEQSVKRQEQLGIRVSGQFRSLHDENTLVWIRAFDSQEQRLRLLRDYYLDDSWLNDLRHTTTAKIESVQVIFVEPTAASPSR